LPEKDFAKVSEAEKDEIEERMERADETLGKLISYLNEKRFYQAATYITGARKSMFSYVRRGLKLGVICPRASSLIERVIMELGRRLNKLAYGWSDNGAAKIARIILKKFTNEQEWEKYWETKVNIVGKVIFGIGNYKVSEQFLRH
jgi:transcription initiation factor IIE alpha subunit